jgi:hypothetical protein
MAGADRMAIEEVVRKVLVDEHGPGPTRSPASSAFDNLHQALLTMRQLIAVLETTTQHPE